MTSKNAAIISFLNTALGIWMLSTLAVGLISTGYSMLSAHLAELSKKEAQILRLHIEIRQRAAQLSGQLDNLSDKAGFDQNKPDETVAAAVTSFLIPPAVSAQSTFPIYSAFDEYKERPIVSLVVEIAFLLGPQKSRCLTPSIEELSSLTQDKLEVMPVVQITKQLEEMFFSKYWIIYMERLEP